MVKAPNLDYPFQNSFVKVLEPWIGKAPFRYIYLSANLLYKIKIGLYGFCQSRKTKVWSIMPNIHNA